MRVLVTGAAGFVGKRLVPRLMAEGCTVEATDRDLDVTDPSAIDSRLDAFRPDAIVHLAAVSSVAISRKEPSATYRVNYVGSRCLLESVRRRASHARVLLVSTADVYGSSETGAQPFDEASDLRPRSPYARTKAAADLLGGVHAARGLDVLRVRPFNHTGPGQLDVFVLPSFARQVAAIEAGISEPVLRVGNLDSVRDFLCVDDVIEAYAQLLGCESARGVYNVASGTGIRIGDALEHLCSAAGISPRIEVADEFFRPTDRAVGSSERLQRDTGWSPRTPFTALLESLLDDWRERITAA